MEGSSGLIIAFVVVLWAAYFVPLVLRRYDDVSKNESVGEGSNRKTLTSIRAHNSAQNASPAQNQAPKSAPVQAPVATRVQTHAPAEARVSADSARPRISRQAAIVAARRRRNTLLTLIVALLAVIGVAAYGAIDWWWVAAPVGLIAAWLVACRIMVRGELGLGKPSLSRRTSESAATQADDEELTDEISLEAPAAPRASKAAGMWQRVKATAASAGSSVVKVTAKATAKKTAPPTGADAEATIVVAHQFEEYDPDTRHVMEKDVPLEADALDEQLHIAVPSVSVTSGEPLWDPLPVTVPTYVTKPRAGRTVRTIDFSQPGTWTSGHVEGEQTELPGRKDDDATGTDRKAVGH